MLRAGPVAGFAGDAQIRGTWIELIFCGGGGGVAAEAEASFVGRDGTARSIIESCWHGMGLAGSDVERLRGVVETDVAFIEFAVLLVDESLAHVARP